MCQCGRSGYSAATSSGYIRMQPCVIASPSAVGLLVPWISYVPSPKPSRILKSPNGLSGPGPTTAGNGSPASACSSRIEAGGYHEGCSTLAMLRERLDAFLSKEAPAIHEILRRYGSYSQLPLSP